MKDQKVVARCIVEIAGSPKEHVEKTMQLVIDKIKERKEIKIENSDTAEVKQVKEPFWSTFTEFELEFKGLNGLVDFCFDFMPSSVEILEPKELHTSIGPINDLMNDLVGRLHQYDMALKNINAQNIMMKRKLDQGS